MLTVENLSYAAGSRVILQGAGLEVRPGEFVGIIGPNGSGKSTLLKNIYKVLHPQSGSISLMGGDLLAMSSREMAQRLAGVIQEQEGGFDFTVEEVIMMGRHARKGLLESENGRDQALVDEMLRRTQLQSVRGQSFTTLSGGEKQRVLIARALVQDTPCLILDEPTNHLDIKYQLQLMDLVRELGRTALAAIHDLNIAAMYCHRLYVLKKGEVIASGTPEQVLTPQLIRQVYEVDAEVTRDRRGQLRVFFCPNTTQQEELP